MIILHIEKDFDGYEKISIKIEPSRSISELLECACKELKLDSSSSSYSLYHKRSKLIGSDPIRLTSLSPGSTINIKKSNNTFATKKEQTQANLKIALSMNNTRYTANIPFTLTLKQVWKHFCGQHHSINQIVKDGKYPCLLVGGREWDLGTFDGDKRLVDMGIDNGSVLIRVTRFIDGELSIDELDKELVENTNHNSTNLDMDSGKIKLSHQIKTENITIGESLNTNHLNINLKPDLTGYKIKIYKIPPKPAPIKGTDYEDEEYKPTIHQLKQHQQYLHKKVDRLYNAPLLSKQTIEKKKREKLLADHPTTLIRFRFFDFFVEATFESDSEIECLWKFLKTLLGVDSQSSSTFTLSTGPPFKKQLDTKEMKLWECNLVPAAMVMVHLDGNSTDKVGIDQLHIDPKDYSLCTTNPDDVSVDEQRRINDKTNFFPTDSKNNDDKKSKIKPSWLKL